MHTYHHQGLRFLIVSSDEHLVAILQTLVEACSQNHECAYVSSAFACSTMLHHGFDAVFIDARELYGYKGKGLAECVFLHNAALIVLARTDHDALLAYDIEATDCLPIPLHQERFTVALKRIAQYRNSVLEY
ncbi:MAG: hypothetical protein RML40_08990 [Bacteroidota bacterium]|nr:hypothetical protein [Candidatus Kapabacteria bacterium]MDW8220653.1 hypothetical protein [Bacteroidota bacterium]